MLCTVGSIEDNETLEEGTYLAIKQEQEQDILATKADNSTLKYGLLILNFSVTHFVKLLPLMVAVMSHMDQFKEWRGQQHEPSQAYRKTVDKDKIPTVFRWVYKGYDVCVCTSFTGWSTKLSLIGRCVTWVSHPFTIYINLSHMSCVSMCDTLPGVLAL